MDKYLTVTATRQAEFQHNLNAAVMEGYTLHSWRTITYTTRTPYSFLAVMVKG